MTASPPEINRFRFDKKLWDSFIQIAQPYFYPLEKNSLWAFSGLLIALLMVVVSLTFFALVGVTKLGAAVLPAQFVDLVAKGLVQQVDAWLQSPFLGICALIFLVGAGVFAAFWRKIRHRWLPWLMLGGLIFLLFAINGINVGITFIARVLDNSLVAKEQASFWQFLGIYVLTLVIALPVRGALSYLPLKLGLLWREWLTDDFLRRYFGNRVYYRLDSNSADTAVDNPDQRITEDVKAFTDTTLSFLIQVFDAVLTLISFTAILWTISKQLTLGLLAYAVIGTAISVLAGTKLIRINFDQLRLEANFRYGMVHVRDNAETIAFYQGEAQERRQVRDRFGQVLLNFDRLIIWNTILSVYQRFYDYFSRIPPYLIVVPLYFSGQQDFGVISQSILAFSQILGALSIITYQIQEISRFAAGVNRLGSFEQVMRTVERTETDRNRPQISTEYGPLLRLVDVTLETPDYRKVLVKDLNLSLADQEALLIVGPSGFGKTSLLRAIAGLWNSGQGQIERPSTQDILFLPQRPYMLLGNLRSQLVYPHAPGRFSDAELLDALERVNLRYILDDRPEGFDALEDWSSVFSLGEQQRLAFARIVLSRPKFAILDEGTSALDVANEHRVYTLLRNLGISYVSVGHRPTLCDFHETVLEILPESQWRTLSADEYRAQQ
ncbi:ABC transporter ATP-binding protein/permease [Synechococcus elongatus]|uniref:ATPase n=1 Tax=Synechococcus elongatus (strain ATCC 33912 / PCC 7942 / FACHB-805) TaxID=1140 RepID=Q31QL5_SYNE7|nr:ABC transporter ATP-binding protein/permease [Synechococcus elongatus]ABB56654.1 ATPase [Synechococcus elongatus PCC 7942 = FACHB-805]AJD58801.1 ABC transporter ATP-binding protein [Synechococcus elongatus UTEX 2973]MBD2588998.1 ABC transporter ATP-binding protein/permease [Synechococcus elongatus FACHB-242]MBD2690064.1 ABC transporter ATP-binding protein/permease [Synechococcus elongatus FACHB-1061]MBD2708507.1 ABC transporter ATP-binding protein/permease [Synechococcus elongatus PCC 7942 